jgi:hypothetical protein
MRTALKLVLDFPSDSAATTDTIDKSTPAGFYEVAPERRLTITMVRAA